MSLMAACSKANLSTSVAITFLAFLFAAVNDGNPGPHPTSHTVHFVSMHFSMVVDAIRDEGQTWVAKKLDPGGKEDVDELEITWSSMSIGGERLAA